MLAQAHFFNREVMTSWLCERGCGFPAYGLAFLLHSTQLKVVDPSGGGFLKRLTSKNLRYLSKVPQGESFIWSSGSANWLTQVRELIHRLRFLSLQSNVAFKNHLQTFMLTQNKQTKNLRRLVVVVRWFLLFWLFWGQGCVTQLPNK